MSSPTDASGVAPQLPPDGSAAGGPGPLDEPAEINLRICGTLVRFVRDHHGSSGLEAVAAKAHLRVADLDGSNRWSSAAQVEAFLAAVRALVQDDEAFKAACAYQLRQAFGPLGAVLWATTPMDVHLLAFRNMHLVSRISRYEVVSSSPTSVEVRYLSQRAESRLLCLLRQAQGTALSTLWGLPPGQLREGKCIARGDEACEYRFRLYRARHLTPVLVGLTAGALGAVGLGLLAAPPLVGLLALPVAGALVGALVDQQRRLRANLHVGEEIIADLKAAAAESADARRELLGFQQRERQWTRLLEEQLDEKTRLLQEAVATVQGAAQRRVSVLRGFSHDLRNPLAVLRANIDTLRARAELIGEDGPTIVDEQAGAVAQLDELTRMLIVAAQTEGARVPLKAERVEVMPLVDKLRKRLSAFVQGRSLRTMVFPTRDAPAFIETDLLVFDRVIDNLFTNAAKYTERGSIAVEIGGTPGHLTIKVSDTGVGIEPEQLERIFEPGGSRNADRAPGSHGLGLSVVVQLLHQIGGRLEVLSKRGTGTTFWAHFPETIKPSSTRERDEPAKVLRRVLNIRRAAAS